MNSHILAELALDQIPKILTLQDRNPHSATYGCFDRNFWHYKIVDFPSGMAQEFVWPLALAYDTDVPGNRFYRKESLKDWIQAGIRYASRSAHDDGSCDDYFPYERAGGAAAFSLLACMESYIILGLSDDAQLQFFRKRANWLAGHLESGCLSNHQALIVLCLEVAGKLLKTEGWKDAAAKRLELLLSWQDEEGWFREYEGFDPGYQTLTLSCLARIFAMNPEKRIEEAIRKAVRLVRLFVHPDGSFGGEYTSRNTFNFFPHGFELIGGWMPEALEINDRILDGLANGKGACHADDHIIGHHAWNFFLAWRDYVQIRPPRVSFEASRIWLPHARLLVEQRGDLRLVAGLNKGGAFKLFRGNELVASDTQISLLVRHKGKLRNAVAHLVSDSEVAVTQDSISVQGVYGWTKQQQMTSFKLIVLRLVMFTGGRFFPNLIRRLLQKMLITGKKNAPFSFHRVFEWKENNLVVRDRLEAESWTCVEAAGIGGSQTSIYVVMSRTFQESQMQPWLDLADTIPKLSHGQPLIVERTF